MENLKINTCDLEDLANSLGVLVKLISPKSSIKIQNSFRDIFVWNADIRDEHDLAFFEETLKPISEKLTDYFIEKYYQKS